MSKPWSESLSRSYLRIINYEPTVDKTVEINHLSDRYRVVLILIISIWNELWCKGCWVAWKGDVDVHQRAETLYNGEVAKYLDHIIALPPHI